MGPFTKHPPVLGIPESVPFLLYRAIPLPMVLEELVFTVCVIRSHKAADFFVIFRYCDSPATWCWKGES